MRIAKMILALLIVTFAILATDSVAENEIYRWVDENGVVHFGDQPPANTAAGKVSVQTSKISTAPSSSAATLEEPSPLFEPEPSAAQKIRDERAERRAEIAENKRITEETCAQRKAVVSQLEPSTRVLVRLEDGTVTRMDDDVRLETLNEAKSYIAQNCDK